MSCWTYAVMYEHKSIPELMMKLEKEECQNPRKMIGKFVVLKELHQNSGTTGGFYEGLDWPTRDAVLCWIY